MRQMVIDLELEQLKKIIAEEYDLSSGVTKAPQITLIFVNKRVR